MRYPRWQGERVAIRDATSSASVDGMRVAGRYLVGRSRCLLEDQSAIIEILPIGAPVGHGDLLVGTLRPVAPAGSTAGFELTAVSVLVTAGRSLPPQLLRVAQQRPALRRRAAIIAAIRAYFVGEGFLEVETPSRVTNPGLEPHLVPFPAGRGVDQVDRYLVTSPELHLKRLLVAGYERVFELARAFRDDEAGRLHASEFLLLEWYRSFATLDALLVDLSALLRRSAIAAEIDATTGIAQCDLSRPPTTATYGAVFRRHAGCDPATLSIDERERRFVTEVEPHLGIGAPLVVTEFPPDVAALSRLVPPSDATGYERVAARMELYIAGVELANGFDELNDPDEQRRRHEADRATRRSNGVVVPPLDEGFLAGLEAGMPPAAGMALGVDRLVMLLTGHDDISAVRAFL